MLSMEAAHTDRLALLRSLTAYTYGAAMAAPVGPRRSQLFDRWRALRRLLVRRQAAPVVSSTICTHARTDASRAREDRGLTDHRCLDCGARLVTDSTD